MIDANIKSTSKEVIEKIKNLGLQGSIDFYFIPSQTLINMIIRGGDPVIDSLPLFSKKLFTELERDQGVLLDTNMVWKYIDGTLDKKNTYLFDLGEIKIYNLPVKELVIKGLNKSKDK